MFLKIGDFPPEKQTQNDRRFRFESLLVLIAMLGCAGCASRPAVFQDAAPAAEAGDNHPSAVPAEKDFEIVENLISSSVRHPLINIMDMRRIPRSQDVNALDQVPASTWFTPRLGFKTLTAEEILRGPEEIGPPQAPLTVIKKKDSGSNPGFIIKDSRGQRYLIKMDEPEYPGFESTVDFVIGRLFWALGYNVPEDYVFYFKRSDLTSEIDPLDFEKAMTFGMPDEDGRVRSTASLWIPGKSVGHTPQKGVRKDDPNDRIAHENRRTLRALKVFCALTQQTGIRSDNTLDVYTGEEGRGHVVHYLLDFGEALGGHAMGRNRHWDGFEHFFSWEDTLKHAAGLGLRKRAWEHIEFQDGEKQPYFEAEAFTPDEWREVYQFQPIRMSRPDDDYWAAKIISAVTEKQLRTLFDAADYPEKDHQEHLIQTLLRRKQILLEWALARVTPLESTGVESGSLQVTDMRRALLGEMGTAQYEIRFYDRGRRQLAAAVTMESTDAEFKVPLDSEILAADYVRVEIRMAGSKAAPAEFHLQRGSGTAPRLTGVLH